MTADVVNLADERQARERGWRVSYALCAGCGRTWIAVHPGCDVALQCPECGGVTGEQVSEAEFRVAQAAKHGRDGRVVMASNRFARKS